MWKSQTAMLRDIYIRRYTSGVTVLSSCEKVAEKVKTCMKKASGRQQLCAHYWAAVVGNPQPNSGFLKVGLMLKENPSTCNDKQVCVNPFLSQSGDQTLISFTLSPKPFCCS